MAPINPPSESSRNTISPASQRIFHSATRPTTPPNPSTLSRFIRSTPPRFSPSPPPSEPQPQTPRDEQRNHPLSDEECKTILDLSRRFYATLPREVRDYVYEYFCIADNPDTTDPIVDAKDAAAPLKSFQQDHLLQSDVVGQDVAREAAEVFYSRNHFILEDDHITEFLSTDVLDVGTVPALSITQLDVRIRYYSASHTTDSVVSAVRQNLQALSLIKRKETCKLSLTAWADARWLHRAGDWEQAVEVIQPVFVQLKRQGLTDIAVFWYDERDQSGHRPRVDVTNIFQQGFEESMSCTNVGDVEMS